MSLRRVASVLCMLQYGSLNNASDCGSVLMSSSSMPGLSRGSCSVFISNIWHLSGNFLAMSRRLMDS